MGLTGGEWLALGIGLGGLATVVSLLAAVELERRRRRIARRRRLELEDPELEDE